MEARISDDIFASTSVIIRVEAANKILSADPDQSLRFPSPIYSVIIPFNTPVGQTILHLRVEKSKRRSNSVVRYRINSFDPYQKKALFSLDPWKGSLKISRQLPQLDSPYDKPVNFVLQVVARTQENERNTLTAATRVSIVVVPEYAGNDYVQSSLAVVKNTSEAVDSSRRLRFNKSATSRERTEFSLHRMFRRLSPEAKRVSKADLRFCEIIRELKREVADHLLGWLLFISFLLTMHASEPWRSHRVFYQSRICTLFFWVRGRERDLGSFPYQRMPLLLTLVIRSFLFLR